MYDKDRRRLRSRIFRFTTRTGVVRKAPFVMCLGWALGLAGGTTPVPGDDAAVHMAFVGTLVGGALAFMAMFAGISHWVAEPAARKVLAEHIALGAHAHPELISRAEWDDKHGELMEEVGKIRVMLAEMAGRAGGMTRSPERNP